MVGSEQVRGSAPDRGALLALGATRLSPVQVRLPDDSISVRAAELLDTPLQQMATAYRMSAEIAEWLNGHAERHDLPAVRLVGVRPTGIGVTDARVRPRDAAGTAGGAAAVEGSAGGAPAVEVEADVEVDAHADRLGRRWEHVAVITHADVWDHKGVEYDAVVVDRRGMNPSEVYLAASRAAHELVLVA